MKHFSRTFGALLLGLTLASPAWSFNFNLNDLGKIANIAKKSTELKEVDENGEIAIGEGVASNLLGAAPLVRNDGLQRYVNQVGRWLALQTERPDLAWHFGVIDSMNVNAFAAPGGYIFLTHGLVMKMRNEAELAGVLAHEISHVLRRHHLNAIQKNAQMGILGDVLNVAAERNRNSEALKKVVSTGTELYARGLDKDDEFEADRMGIVIATRAGYDPYGLPAVLQTLDHMNPQDGSLALMFKTHPSP
ncbi:MAG: M48 family metalloprotease, partial [Sulfurimicrobium sp.]|nr:M48 family metalloprotease [Sulfurimicrobium sp.]